MKKIAVFTGSDLRNYGGGEKDIINWTKRLKDKLDITIYSRIEKNTRTTTEYIESELKGIKVMWYKGKQIRLMKDILTFKRFDLSEFDAVYSSTQGHLLNKKLQKTCKRFILGIHTPSTLSETPIENKLWKKLLYNHLYRKQISIVHNSNAIRIQNSTDMERLEKIGYVGKIYNIPPVMFDTTSEPIINSGDFKAIWVNRVSPEKRPEELVKIAKLCPDIEFQAIGSGKLSHLFNGIKNITYYGFIPDKELYMKYQRASVYISTSRGENFGMSAMEAMAYGVPTISYNVMGLKDYCRFVEQDIDHIVKRLHALQTRFMSHPEEYLQYRKDLRTITLRDFSNTIILPLILDMMEGN